LKSVIYLTNLGKASEILKANKLTTQYEEELDSQRSPIRNYKLTKKFIKKS
jgi:hypothetical protein